MCWNEVIKYQKGKIRFRIHNYENLYTVRIHCFEIIVAVRIQLFILWVQTVYRNSKICIA